MHLTVDEARRRLLAARVAYLATIRTDGRPHLVPIVFEVDGERIYSIADPKPKRRPDLLRLRNVAANPAVSLLVDEYDEDWTRLWWVRVDGSARVVERGPDRDRAIRLLRHKYPQYMTWSTPFGGALIVTADRWSSWALAGGT